MLDMFSSRSINKSFLNNKSNIFITKTDLSFCNKGQHDFIPVFSANLDSITSEFNNLNNFDLSKFKVNSEVNVSNNTTNNTTNDSLAVVRWCVNCGAITVDLDVNGKTEKDCFRKIQIPNLTKEIKG